MNLQELSREMGSLSFLYDAEVAKWSNADFNFSYSVSLMFLSFVVKLVKPVLRG